MNYGPVYTIPFSYEKGMEMFHFGLPLTLKRFPTYHPMQAISYESIIVTFSYKSIFLSFSYENGIL